MIRRPYLIFGAISYAVIIAYGSLVPFQYQPIPFNEMLQQFSEVLSKPLRGISKSDFLANVMLFIPFSFLIMGCCSSPGKLTRNSILLLLVTCLCIGFGTAIEFTQLLFPPRKAALNDILAQSIGSLTGCILWLVAGNRLITQVNTLNTNWLPGNRLIRFLPLYLLLIVILESVPFDFTLSPVEMVHKWREGRIGVVPFAAFLDPERGMVNKSLWNIVLFLPVGLLLGTMQGLKSFRVLAVGLLIAGGVEVIQLFVLTRYFEPTDILTGTGAIWMGWSLLQLQGQSTTGKGAAHSNGSLFAVLFAIWFVLVAAINWSPFDFTSDGIQLRLQQISLIPFADYQQKHYLSAFDDLIHKLLLFMLLGLLLSANPAQSRGGLTVMLLGGLLSAVIELGQVFLPSRYPSVSDVILGAGASLAGYGLVHAYRHAGQSTTLWRVNHQA